MGKGWLLIGLLGAMPLVGAHVQGRVTDGQHGLPGVRVYPDRLRKVRSQAALPWVETDGDGRFSLDLEAGDDVLVVEKSGWQMDFIPRASLNDPVILQKAPQFRVERVVVVRLDFQDEASSRGDGDMRELLFSRRPGTASAANYIYEVSKGSLELAEGVILHLKDRKHRAPRSDDQRRAMVRDVFRQLKSMDLRPFDRVDNRTGALRSDGRPDHLWIIPPGSSRSVSTHPAHLSPISFLEPLPWKASERWSVLFFTEETPLGSIVHETFHEMGEHRVDDFYLGCEDPLTAGGWDLMDAGMYRGWDRSHKDSPWQDDTGYSPSHPMGWTRAELWYYGRFSETLSTLKLKSREWTGWLDPLVRAPHEIPQRLVVSDPRKRGCFWELNVRRPWGFDRGRVGDRWGPGYEGLVVARVDPSKLSRGNPRGPVRVVDAHPGSSEPDPPRYPCGRWELDDAAFNLGPGECSSGQDGPLRWEVLDVDACGRMKIRIQLR